MNYLIRFMFLYSLAKGDYTHSRPITGSSEIDGWALSNLVNNNIAWITGGTNSEA
jgi:hypothetical protein